MGISRAPHPSAGNAGTAALLGRDVRFAAHCGLKSDIARGPKSARGLMHRSNLQDYARRLSRDRQIETDGNDVAGFDSISRHLQSRSARINPNSPPLSIYRVASSEFATA
jgi:hypothetical protein